MYSSTAFIGFCFIIGLKFCPFWNNVRFAVVPLFHLLSKQMTFYVQLNDITPSLHYHYNSFFITTGYSAPIQHITTFGLIFLWLVPFRLSLLSRFLCFTSKPVMHSCRLNTGCRVANRQFGRYSCPWWVVKFKFWHRFTLSILHQRFTCVHLYITYMTIIYGLFHSCSLP